MKPFPCKVYLLIVLPFWIEGSLLDRRPSTAWDTLRCNKDEVACLDQRRCIPKARVCDGQQDCIDNSDELECENSCRGDAFRCRNGKCISRKWICDSFDDCGDSSDEIYHCLGVERLPCSQDAYRCEEGPCIPMSLVCDGKTHCPRGDDETRCRDELSQDPSKEANLTPRENGIGESMRRPDRHFKPEARGSLVLTLPALPPSPGTLAKSSGRSFEAYGSVEMKPGPKRMEVSHPHLTPSDPSDPLLSFRRESYDLIMSGSQSKVNPINRLAVNAYQIAEGNQSPFVKPENELICADYEFKCADDLRCVPQKARCDQRYDCVDQSDEKNCTIDPCVFGLFRCHSGKCAISSWRCNATDWTGRRVTVLSKDFESFL